MEQKKWVGEFLAGLDELAKTIKGLTSDERTLFELNGNNFQWPMVSCGEMEFMATDLADYCKERVPEVEGDSWPDFEVLATRVKWLRSHVAPYLFNGNGIAAFATYSSSLAEIRSYLTLYFPDVLKLEKESYPFKLARKASQVKSSLDRTAAEVDGLATKVRQILDAHDAAEALPADMELLRSTRHELSSLAAQAKVDAEGAKRAKTELEGALRASEEQQAKVEKIVENCEAAYSITTTKGLAGAFDVRSAQLARSMWVWVMGLIIALFFASMIGAERVNYLSQAVAMPNPGWGSIAVNIVLAAVSVGAPLWFAWIATRQITERFRLAEDYGFKASVAKAYQGYRKEAHLLDEAFEAQLFSIALTRLEEAPLRLVNSESHGSPWHELLSSPVVRDALKSVPEFGSDVMRMAKEAISKKTTTKPDEGSTGDSANPKP